MTTRTFFRSLLSGGWGLIGSILAICILIVLILMEGDGQDATDDIPQILLVVAYVLNTWGRLLIRALGGPRRVFGWLKAFPAWFLQSRGMLLINSLTAIIPAADALSRVVYVHDTPEYRTISAALPVILIISFIVMTSYIWKRAARFVANRWIDLSFSVFLAAFHLGSFYLRGDWPFGRPLYYASAGHIEAILIAYIVYFFILAFALRPFAVLWKNFSIRRSARPAALVLVLLSFGLPCAAQTSRDVAVNITYAEGANDDPVRFQNPPLVGVEVIVYDADDGSVTGDPWWSVWDDELGRGISDTVGDVLVHVVSDDSGGPDIYAEVEDFVVYHGTGAKIADIEYDINNFPINHDIWFKTVPVMDANQSTLLNIDVLLSTTGSANISDSSHGMLAITAAADIAGEIFESADWLYKATGFLRSELEIVTHDDPTQDPDAPYFQPGPGTDFIQTNASDRFVNHTTSHEYGHAVMHDLYGFLNYPLGDAPAGHRVFTESTRGGAMKEGWAEFFAAAVHNDPNFPTWRNPDSSTASMEKNYWWMGGDTNGTNNSGEIVEGALASIWWDLIDTDNSDEEFSIIDGTAIHFDTFQNVWLPISMDPPPKNIRGFWNNLGGSLLTTPAERTKLRGIFERNGVVLNREKFSASAMPAAGDTQLATHVIWGSANLATVAGPQPPVISDPVDIESRRVQILKVPLSDTANPADQQLGDWQEITGVLYDELKWEPNDVSTGFSTSTPSLDLYGILGATTYAEKLALEGQRHAVRVQDKLAGGARASFYPDIDQDSDDATINDPDIYTSEWLAEQGTLRRVMIDNFAPYVNAVVISTDNDTRYAARWPLTLASDSELEDLVVSDSLAISDTPAWTIELEFSEPMGRDTAPVIAVRFAGSNELTLSGIETWLSDTLFRLETNADPFAGGADSGAAKLHITAAADLAGTSLDGQPKTIASRDATGSMLAHFHGGDLVHEILIASESTGDSITVSFGYFLDRPETLEGSAYLDSDAIMLSREIEVTGGIPEVGVRAVTWEAGALSALTGNSDGIHRITLISNLETFSSSSGFVSNEPSWDITASPASAGAYARAWGDIYLSTGGVVPKSIDDAELGDVWEVSWEDGGDRIVSGYDRITSNTTYGVIDIHNFESGSTTRIFEGENVILEETHIDYSALGDSIVISFDFNDVSFIDAETGDMQTMFPGFAGNWSPDQTQIVHAVSGTERTIRIRSDKDDWTSFREITPSGKRAFAPSWSRTGTIIIYKSVVDNQIKLFATNPAPAYVLNGQANSEWHYFDTLVRLVTVEPEVSDTNALQVYARTSSSDSFVPVNSSGDLSQFSTTNKKIQFRFELSRSANTVTHALYGYQFRFDGALSGTSGGSYSSMTLSVEESSTTSDIETEPYLEEVTNQMPNQGAWFSRDTGALKPLPMAGYAPISGASDLRVWYIRQRIFKEDPLPHVSIKNVNAKGVFVLDRRNAVWERAGSNDGDVLMLRARPGLFIAVDAEQNPNVDVGLTYTFCRPPARNDVRIQLPENRTVDMCLQKSNLSADILIWWFDNRFEEEATLRGKVSREFSNIREVDSEEEYLKVQSAARPDLLVIVGKPRFSEEGYRRYEEAYRAGMRVVSVSFDDGATAEDITAYLREKIEQELAQ